MQTENDELRRASILDSITAPILTEWIDVCLGQLERADWGLFRTESHEIAFVHRFALYLESSLIQHWLRFVAHDPQEPPPQCELSVDIEYNRDGLERPKRLYDCGLRIDGNSRLIRPDLIVHRRGDGEMNLLVSEWKKVAPARWAYGLRSRRALLVARTTNIMRQFGYRYGLAVDLRLGEPLINWHLSAWDSDDEATIRTLRDWDSLEAD